jgi:hypothetical protein
MIKLKAILDKRFCTNPLKFRESCMLDIIMEFAQETAGDHSSRLLEVIDLSFD